MASKSKAASRSKTATRKATTRKSSMRKATAATAASRTAAANALADETLAEAAAKPGTTSKAPSTKAAQTSRRKTPAASRKSPVAPVKTPAAPAKSTPVAKAAAPADTKVSLPKRALLERIAARTGLRKSQVRPVVEAMLAEMGEALERKEILKLQPLGVMRVVRANEGEKVNVMVCKLRRKNSEKDADAPLAKPDEEG